MDDGSSHFFAGKMRYAKGGTIDSIIASQKGRSTIKQRIGVLRESLRLLLRGNDKKQPLIRQSKFFQPKLHFQLIRRSKNAKGNQKIAY